MRTPHHAHSSATTGFDARDAVLENEALFGGDGRFRDREGFVYGVQGEKEHVREGFATPGGDAFVVAEDAAVRVKDGEELG